jgi:hypothetical protein
MSSVSCASYSEQNFELKPGEGPNDEEELFECTGKALAKR